MSRRNFLALAAALGVALPAAGTATGCSSRTSSAQSTQARGRILSANGTVLAESSDAGTRAYPEGSFACHAVGTCNSAASTSGAESCAKAALLDGRDVTLTLEDATQRALEQVLVPYVGAAVAIDPATGAILGLASNPTFDPANPSAAAAGDSALTSLAQTQLPCGSVFKTVTLVAALEEGLVKASDTFDIPGNIAFAEGTLANVDNETAAAATLDWAYARSLSTLFAELALQLGQSTLARYAEALGFDKQIAQDLACDPSELLLPDAVSDYELAWSGAGLALWSDADRPTGPVSTLLHQTAIAAAFANGGTLWMPYAVAQVAQAGAEGADTSAAGDRTTPRAISTSVASGATVAYVYECMRAVVAEGTGKNAQVNGLVVAGKTGTAEQRDSNHLGWFVGTALPNDEAASARPIAVGVMLSGHDSDAAADVARQIIEQVCLWHERAEGAVGAVDSAGSARLGARLTRLAWLTWRLPNPDCVIVVLFRKRLRYCGRKIFEYHNIANFAAKVPQ